MTLDPDNGFGLLSSEDQEKMEEVLTERSDGSYGAPALQGMLTASVVGPKPVPMDWILQNMPLAFGQMIECFPKRILVKVTPAQSPAVSDFEL
jgi:hypothetical protein